MCNYLIWHDLCDRQTDRQTCLNLIAGNRGAIFSCNGGLRLLEFRGGLSGFFFLFLLTVFLSYFAQSSELKGGKSSLAIPEKALIRMERGEFRDKDLKELAKLSKKGDVNATAVLAQFYGEFSGDLLSALQLLCPLLFEKAVSDEILRFSADRKRSYEELLLKIPHSSSWRKEQSLACVAMGRILAVNGKYAAAASAFDLVGMNTEGLPQSLAAEGVGDMNFLLKRWEESVRGYDFALNVLANMRNRSEFETEKDSIVIVEERIRRKIEKAKKMWDSERYGPEFVAYREARRADFDRDYAIAVLRYSQIRKDYPETVYSEAAGLYGPICLLNLADPDAEKALQTKISAMEKKLSDEKKKLKLNSKNMAERIVADWRALIAEDEETLAALKALPTGKKAENEGVVRLENFISENEFGLYRGEALVRLAEWAFSKELDMDKAFEKYQLAKKWLNEVDGFNLDVSKWVVPSKAVVVTRPPESEKITAGWNNYIEKAPIKPEQIINRNTCHWYLDSLRCECDKTLGFIYYLKGESDKALELSKSILKYDPMERKFYEEQDANTYQRLQLFYPRGWLYAPPEELAFFKGKLLLAVKVAEFYYAQEEWEKCLRIRQDIYDEKYGKLNREQKGIMLYRLADITVWTEETNAPAIALLQPFTKGEFKGTYIYPIALYGLSTIDGMYLDDKAAMLRTIGYCEEAMKYVEDKKCDLADKIRYFMAERYYRSLHCIHKEDGALKKAISIYNDILKNPKSRWRNLVLNDISEIEGNKSQKH